MSVCVEFTDGGRPWQKWPDAAEAPAVGSKVDIVPVGGDARDGVTAEVREHHWYGQGRIVLVTVATA